VRQQWWLTGVLLKPVLNESDMVALVKEAAMVAFRCAVVLK
jgi:hypothetical protein